MRPTRGPSHSETESLLPVSQGCSYARRRCGRVARVRGGGIPGTSFAVALIVVASVLLGVGPVPDRPVPCPGMWGIPLAVTPTSSPGPGVLAPCPGNEIAYVERGPKDRIIVMFPSGANKGAVYETEKTLSPNLAWSPDSRSIAFIENERLWRVGLSLHNRTFVGGVPQLLT